MDIKKTPGDRIVTLRNLLGKKQSEFAEEIGITQSALSQIENKNRGISTDMLIRITEKYQVNADWLLHGSETTFKTQKVTATPQEIQPPSENLIPLVDKEAHADYPANCEDDAYVKQFSLYRIPGFEEGNFRMFEVVGDSMEPTLFEKEFIITELVENAKSVGDGKIYVVISQKGIVVKRVFVYEDGFNALIMKSDNPKYHSYKMQPKEIYEIWEVKGKVTNHFLSSQKENVGRISELEERMAKMEKLLKEFLDK